MEFQLAAFGLAAVGTLSLPILLALLLAKSRLHWLFQSLPIFALACPLIFVEAFDLTLIVFGRSIFGFDLLQYLAVAAGKKT